MPTPYITTADLIALYGQEDFDLISQTNANLDSVITAVCAEADAYVLSAAIAPVSDAIIQVVKFAVADLCRFRAYNQAASETVRQRAEDALRFLRMIANRQVVLPQSDDPNTPNDEGSSGAVSAAAPRQMGRGFDGGW
jgi:phage gp36-like protein